VQLAPLALIAAALAAWPACALQIRADRDDAEYLELATRYGACIPLAFEGEGVLVASRWVLTSARVASGLRALKKALPPVRFAGIEHEIQAIFDEGDVGLILLRKPVTNVAPIFLHRSSDEAGKPVVFVAHGRGGRIGEKEAAPDRKARAAINTIDRVTARSLALEVKGPDDASDLQGALASDEDGAAAIVETRDGLFVAGIATGRERSSAGLVKTGDRDLYARVSAYVGWIEGVMLQAGAREAAELLGDGDRR
jgi:hypothetical protein